MLCYAMLCYATLGGRAASAARAQRPARVPCGGANRAHVQHVHVLVRRYGAPPACGAQCVGGRCERAIGGSPARRAARPPPPRAGYRAARRRRGGPRARARYRDATAQAPAGGERTLAHYAMLCYAMLAHYAMLCSPTMLCYARPRYPASSPAPPAHPHPHPLPALFGRLFRACSRRTRARSSTS